MKIVIDGRLWFETGVGRYIRNLVENLGKVDKADQFYLVVLEKDQQKINLPKNFTKVLADYKWYGLKEQVKLPAVLKKIQPDLVHFPHFNVPMFYQGKFVVTIHDLIHQHFPTQKATTHDFLTYQIKRIGYHRVFSKAVRGAKQIIVPSNFVKNQLIKEWQINQDKITVTYEGVEEKLLDLAKKDSADFGKVRQFQVKKPYLFYAGNAHPHKNVPALIKVFLKIKKEFPELSLVLAGPDNYFWQRIKSTYREPGLFFVGFVSDQELVWLYKNALAYVAPSLEEGFGIPILEAMVCGCPVVSSNAASLPEVGSDTCLYFDPKNPEDMYNKITRVINDNNLRKRLIQKGFERYIIFSWRKMAIQTLKVYQKCVSL